MKNIYSLRAICVKIAAALCVTLYAVQMQAQDITPPNLRGVTIDPATQRYRLEWTAPMSDTNLVAYYIIGYRIPGSTGGWQLSPIIQRVDSRYRTWLIDNTGSVPLSLLCCDPRAFVVGAVSKDGAGYPVYSDLYQSMQQFDPIIDTCQQHFTLRWSPYYKINSFNFQYVLNFEPEVKYLIYACEGSVFDPARLEYYGNAENKKTFVSERLEGRKTYHFVTAAVYNDDADTSYSNVQTVSWDFPALPVLRMDSVITASGKNRLYFHISSVAAAYTHFVIEKAYSLDSGFTILNNVGISDNMMEDAADAERATYYRVSLVNHCGAVIHSSPALGSIHVRIYPYTTYNIVRWNEIQNVPQNVSDFTAYRISPTYREFVADKLWVQDIDIETGVDSGYCYRVNAVVINSALLPVSAVRSDKVCYFITPTWYMPNAVNPYSSKRNTETGMLRNDFRPVCRNAHEFVLKIYNTWGVEIYNDTTGWNGAKNRLGEDIPEGTYVYWIQITFANGVKEEKIGSVTVVWSDD